MLLVHGAQIARRADFIERFVPLLTAAPPHRLTAVRRYAPGEDACGVYAMRYQGAHPLYSDLRNSASIIYAGSGFVRDRALHHERKLATSRDLDPEDFTFAWLETDGHEIGLFIEQLAIGELTPRWNTPEYRGFGSNGRGRGRAGQRDSPWTILHGRADA